MGLDIERTISSPLRVRLGEGVVVDTVVNDILSELYEDADDFSAKGCTDFFANEELFCAFYDLGQKLHIQGTLIAK
jgi:hypothetical protein